MILDEVCMFFDYLLVKIYEIWLSEILIILLKTRE